MKIKHGNLYVLMSLRNFNFRCLGYRQKKFNDENFPIYSSVLAGVLDIMPLPLSIYRACRIITLAVILDISSADGVLLSRAHYIYMGRYNREQIHTNRNCILKCSLSLRVFAVLMFLWLFHVHQILFFFTF